jgi:hypothetical protein
MKIGNTLGKYNPIFTDYFSNYRFSQLLKSALYGKPFIMRF